MEWVRENVLYILGAMASAIAWVLKREWDKEARMSAVESRLASVEEDVSDAKSARKEALHLMTEIQKGVTHLTIAMARVEERTKQPKE